MLKRQVVWLALLATSWLGALARAGDSESSPEFRSAKVGLQQQLRSRREDDRIDALRQLKQYSGVDAAKLALNVAVKDESAEVRDAAYGTLTSMTDNGQVGKFLLDSLDKQLRRKQASDTAAPLLAALISSKNSQVEQDAIALLDKLIETTPGVRLIGIEMIDALAAKGTDDDVALLVKLSKTKSFANQFGFRRSVIWALGRIDSLPGIGALIGMVGDIDGEAQADAIKYLTAVTGQALGNNQTAWAKWWEANRESFVIPPQAGRTLATAANVSPGVTMYYGLPVYARKLVFIMDTSHSMRGQRLMAAKRELIQAIDRLQPQDSFTVLVFDNNVRMWQKKLLLADATNKKRAEMFVKKQETAPQTASYDALEAALQFDAEAIFFLTDGAPFGGKVSAPAQIIELITEMNRSRRESIYAIGIGAGMVGSPMDSFLRTLAESNNGAYRRVDE